MDNRQLDLLAKEYHAAREAGDIARTDGIVSQVMAVGGLRRRWHEALDKVKRCDTHNTFYSISQCSLCHPGLVDCANMAHVALEEVGETTKEAQTNEPQKP